MNRWIALLTLFPLVTQLGCGPEQVPGIVRVSGKVTLDGAPVEGAMVTFQPEGVARAASGMTDASGNYKLTTLNPGDGALPGDYKVSISKVEDTDPSHHLSGLELTAMVSQGKGPPPPPGRPNPKAKQNKGMVYHVPQKYMDANKSELTATVAKGNANKFVFELTK